MLMKKPAKSPIFTDLYDVDEYSKLAQPGQFLCPNANLANILFTFNTDGVTLFTSSKTGIWLLYLI